jgi:hypothetical protein
MKWNTFLLIVSVSMLLLWAGSGYIEHLMSADAIAAQLAPRIGVKEDLLRSNLHDILESGKMRRAVVYSTPWAIMSLLLMGRILADVVKKQRERGCSGLDGNG